MACEKASGGDRINCLTIGTFDLFHRGHRALLDECLALMCPTYVGVNDDQFVEHYKHQAPVDDLSVRMSNVRIYGEGTLRVVTHSGSTPQFIKHYAPCYVVIGTDWLRKDYLGQLGISVDWLETNHVRLLYIPYTRGVSSTQLRKELLADPLPPSAT